MVAKDEGTPKPGNAGWFIGIIVHVQILNYVSRMDGLLIVFNTVRTLRYLLEIAQGIWKAWQRHMEGRYQYQSEEKTREDDNVRIARRNHRENVGSFYMTTR